MKYLNKIIEYGLYFLVFFLPAQTRWIIKGGFTEYQSYSLYGTDVLLLALLVIFVVYKILNFEFSSKFKIQNYLIVGLLIISFISVLLAFDKSLVLYKFGWLILGLGLFWLVMSANYDRAKLIYAMLAGIFFQAGLAVWQFLTQSSFASKWLGLAWHHGADLGAAVIETVGADGRRERWLRAYGGLDHPNMLGGLLALGILILVGEMVKNIQYPVANSQTNSKFKIINLKVIFHLILILFSAALFFSFSRAAWLALAAGLLAALVGAVKKKNLLAQKNILQAILVSGLVFFILFFQLPNLVITRVGGGQRLEIKSANERIESLRNSWPIIRNNWLGGVGLGNYVLALERELPGRQNHFYQPAHNTFLLVWAETGILGLIFFMGLIFVIPRHDSGAAIIVTLIVLLSLDHWLWSLHFGVLFFWLILGARPKNDKHLIRQNKNLF